MQNHESDVYSARKNVTQMITEHARACERKAHIRLKRTFYFAESFDKLSGKGVFEMWYPFLYFVFVGTHFKIFVCKFKKLARLLLLATTLKFYIGPVVMHIPCGQGTMHAVVWSFQTWSPPNQCWILIQVDLSFFKHSSYSVYSS